MSCERIEIKRPGLSIARPPNSPGDLHIRKSWQEGGCGEYIAKKADYITIVFDASSSIPCINCRGTNEKIAVIKEQNRVPVARKFEKPRGPIHPIVEKNPGSTAPPQSWHGVYSYLVRHKKNRTLSSQLTRPPRFELWDSVPTFFVSVYIRAVFFVSSSGVLGSLQSL